MVLNVCGDEMALLLLIRVFCGGLVNRTDIFDSNGYPNHCSSNTGRKMKGKTMMYDVDESVLLFFVFEYQTGTTVFSSPSITTDVE